MDGLSWQEKIINDYLADKYYNPGRIAGFKGFLHLYNTAKLKFPNLKTKYVKDWLKNQSTYSVHHKTIRKFGRSFIISPHKDHNWQVDLIEITASRENNNYKFILMIIDVLSKYGWAIPIKNKKPISIKTAFENLLNQDNRKPKIITTDAGTEFINSIFKKFLLENNIKHFIARNETKAAVVERWNRTIKEIISKYCHHNKTLKFIDVLQSIIDSYNSTVHSRTKIKPKDVTSENEKVVYKTLYKKNIKPIEPSLNVGDSVRLQILKSQFEKGYTPNWTNEIFIVQKVLNTLPYPRYIIRDQSGEVLIGSFYIQELLKVNNG